MRTAVFRVLTGFLSVAFGWVLLSGKFADHPLREQWGIGVIAVAFALYAMLGPGLSEQLLWVALGGGRDPGPHPETEKRTQST